MTRRCLVHVYGPQNLLPAISAVRWFGQAKSGNQSANVTLFLHTPGWDSSKLSQIIPIVNKQVQSQGWPPPMIITEGQMQEIVSPEKDVSNPNVQARFRSFLGLQENGVDEVYYSHDVVGYAAPLCMRAFPNAVAITYGESMGLMEDKDYLIASVTGAGWDDSKPHPKFQRREPQATKAVLIMPADQTGDCLSDKELLVVPRDLALEVISNFQSSMPELVQYSRQLLSQFKPPFYLFVVNNLADANFISAEGEADMYAEMIKTHVPQGATVLIKGHPLSTHPIDQMIAERITSSYPCSVIAKEFSRYPMEIWKDLLNETQLVSLSYCSISIEYLYRKPVIYCINEDIIKRYMEERVWNRFRDGDEFFRQQRECLSSWDGKGVICSGKRISFPAIKPKSLTTDVNLAEKLNQEGIHLFQSGKIEEALKIFLQGFKASPGHAGLANNLAAAYWHLGKANESAIYFSIANSINPNDRAVVLNLFQVLVQLGLKEAAKSVCFGYLSRHAEDAEIKHLYEQV